VPLSGEAMFRFPHLDTPLNDSGAAQGITNDSFDSTTFWIGSKQSGHQWVGVNNWGWSRHQ
jgi:hypothetical protein